MCKIKRQLIEDLQAVEKLLEAAQEELIAIRMELMGKEKRQKFRKGFYEYGEQKKKTTPTNSGLAGLGKEKRLGR